MKSIHKRLLLLLLVFIILPYYRNPDLFKVFEQGFEGAFYFNQLEINKGMTNFYLMRNEIRQLRFFINEG